MDQQLGVASVRWVNAVTRKIAPVVLGALVFLASLAVPGMPPMLAMAGGYGQGRADMVVIVAVAAACGVTATLARRQYRLLFVVAIVTWLTLSVFPIVQVAAYYGAIRLTKRRQAVAFLSAAVALIVVPVALGLATETDPGVGILLGAVAAAVLIGLPYALGLWVNARRQVIAGLHERAERLEQEQAARAEQARTEERTRIAREMHDVVAHRVALMVLHAGALEVNASDERQAGEAALIRTTGREALTELRQVLGVLRTEEASLAPQPDLSELPRLIEQTRAAGMEVQFHQMGTPTELPQVVQRTAFRVVQEALTNVVKHAGGAATQVKLTYAPHTVDIRVDNGPPVAGRQTLPGSGLGLIGLRERVALLYGRLDTRTRLDGGFSLHVVLPADVSEVPI